MEYTVRTDKVDRRKHKYYARDVTVHVSPIMPETCSVHDVLAGLPYPVRVRDLSCYSEARSVSFTREFTALRPSEVMSEEEAQKWATEEFVPELKRAVEAAVAAKQERERREDIADQATNLGNWLVDSAIEEARKSTHYRARFDALHEELKEAVAEQVRRLAKEEYRRDIEASDETWPAEAIELPLRLLDKVIKKAIKKATSQAVGPFYHRRSGGPLFTPEDVEESE